MELCRICLENQDVPHSLPCSHSFCFFCISRHLRDNHFCPICFKTPFSKFDLKTECIKLRILDIPSPTGTLKEANMKKILKKYRILTDGSLSIISKRFMDLIEILYKEQFKEKMLSFSDIAWIVNRNSQPKNRASVNKKIVLSLLDLRRSINS
jgi:hypothetical protein